MRGMRTKEEYQADQIALALVKALNRVEEFYGDPDLVMDSAKIYANRGTVRKGVQGAVEALRRHYAGDEPLTMPLDTLG